jgi:hypothetical protein
MARLRSYGSLDDPPQSDGDRLFRGVNARLDPAQLDAGWVAAAINMRFTDGVARVRDGIRTMSWAAENAGGGDYPDGIIFISSYGTVYGAGSYADPIAGTEWLIVATANGVYRARPGTNGAAIPLPAGTVINARCQIVQTYAGLMLLRSNADPLYMESFDVGFQALPTPVVPGNQRTPRSANGIYFQNRLFLVDARQSAQYADSVYVSDFGDVLEGPLAYNQFKINQGSSDRLVALYKFSDTALIAAKTGSIYVVSNVYGTNAELTSNARLDAVTTEYGTNAPRSFVQVGKDVWFLADRRGVVSIAQTEQNKLHGVDVPVSQAIDPIIRRINWQAASNAVAATWANKVYFAVPLGNSTTNNAVLVYDTIQQAWAGYDEGDAVNVRDWVKFTWGGEQRLGFVSGDGYIRLYEDGRLDDVLIDGFIEHASINARLITRGYHGGNVSLKHFEDARATVATWWPDYSVTALLEGVGENRVLASSITRSRLKWHRPHDRDDYDATNVDDDQMDPWRQDYSVLVPAGGILPGSGLLPNLRQVTEESWRLRAAAQSVQIQFASAQGSMEIRSVSVTARRGRVRRGSHA